MAFEGQFLRCGLWMLDRRKLIRDYLPGQYVTFVLSTSKFRTSKESHLSGLGHLYHLL